MSILSLTDISYQVEQRQILDKVNLEVQAGDFLTLTGPSGGGKSTLLKIIASLISPSDGEIIFQGQNQRDYEITTYRQLVSYCFQQPSLFGQTVADNLQFPFVIRNEASSQVQIEQALTKVNLPTSYLNKNITELSGGEKQRVALLRNTMFLPKILLLDEVTVGLDARSIEIVHQFIKQLWQEAGLTIIQITHNQAELSQAAKVLWLEEGSLSDVTTSR
ncbi:spermidine/putrescine ABC transporter ATP-binding protein [Ligilactobacillus agilis]|uniref:Spermidine/putrescine ABC transporter ATP-binding protein n=1 Tax=Ligilactobacillus agilis TaxID=1601 RepID=A0A2I2ABQ4_9LACO|nr:ATP-binding cassette domain-containing protein [Ligilactobacillus agilis]PLA76825.1 spermidine/putrescine ABC transporter ATP-binding protein [Ligilactobacillus agilis]PLA83082.1 spermidine/putrescine ABC transporter ATP-binding protein [Ligilactobacillus agilis]